ncbi:MAG: hypothetical protein WAN43_17765 [Rhodomicrobium sp.]|jgi:hypothetical protein
MSSARHRAKTEDAKAEFARLSGRLRTIAEALKRLSPAPDRHIEEMLRLRMDLDAIRAELLAIDRKPSR